MEKTKNSHLSYIDIAGEIATATYEMSKAYGYETIAKDLRIKSGEAFAKSDDDKAKIYRSLAVEYELYGQTLRKTVHDKAFKHRDNLFEELEAREKNDKKNG